MNTDRRPRGRWVGEPRRFKKPAARPVRAPEIVRGNFPRYDKSGIYQMITYRLSDSLPIELLHRMDGDIKRTPPQRQDAERQRIIGHILDAGHGSCILRDEANAKLVIENWKHFHGTRYDLIAWVVMPNHVHILIRIYPGFNVGKITQGWKGFTGKKLAELSGSEESVWQQESMTRFIRDERHFNEELRLIYDNPVKAELVKKPEDYQWSSFFKG